MMSEELRSPLINEYAQALKAVWIRLSNPISVKRACYRTGWSLFFTCIVAFTIWCVFGDQIDFLSAFVMSSFPINICLILKSIIDSYLIL
jgi:hypothetical protein